MVTEEPALAMPKSATLASPLVGEEHVLGLDVAVDHAPVVGRAERLGDLRPERGGLRRLERSPIGDPLLERAAGHVLHGYVGGSFVRLPPVVDLDDVRVGEARRAAGLPFEALGELAVPGILPSEHLQRHVAPEHPVAG